MAALEAHIAALTRQNVELLLQNPKQSHSEINREEHNSWDYHENNYYEVDSQEGDPPRIHNDEVNFRMSQGGDAGYLDRKVADLEKKCASMAQEIERKDKGKAAMVDRLLMAPVHHSPDGWLIIICLRCSKSPRSKVIPG
jgi:hypothetical protein